MKSVKLIFLVQLSLFFTSNIFANKYQISQLNSDRIAQAYGEIKKDFENNEKMRLYAQTVKWAIIISVIAGVYKVWSIQYDQDTKKMMEAYRKVQQEEKEGALVLATATVSSGNIPANNIKRPIFIRMLNSTKRFGLAFGNFAFPAAVGWVAQEFFGNLAQTFTEVYQERTILWFVQKRTFIDQTLKDMRQIAFKIAPEPKIVNSLPSSTDIENLSACSNSELQELWQLKIQASAMDEAVTLDAKSLEIYKEQLTLFYNRLIADIEHVLAFVEYRFPDDTYAQHVLAKETEQLGNLLSSKLSQDSMSGILSAVLQFSLQFNHVVSHLLFAQKQVNQLSLGGF